MPIALWALVIGAFGIGTAEFVVAGLLPAISAEFDVSIPVAAHLVTSYALGVFVGAPLLIILGSRASQKAMLVVLSLLFIVGNFVTASAPTFDVAIAGRIITSLCHGAFFGIGSILAAKMAPKGKAASAIAFMFSGLTVATLVGVPAGTWLSDQFSWRVTFYVITLIGVATLVAVLVLIPSMSKPPRTQKVSHEFAAFVNVRVLIAMGITVLGPAAFFTAITYISPMMTQVAQFSEASVAWLLIVFGLGLFVGNWLGGRYADKALMPMLYATLLAQAVVLFAFHWLASSQIASVICIFLMAAFGFATVSPIQKLVMDKAMAAGAPTLASAVNIGMFNLGNALGSWLGGLVIAVGFGFTAPNWAGGFLSLAALVLALISGLLDKRQALASKTAG